MYREKTIDGPFRKGEVHSFLKENNLTEDKRCAHPKTIEYFVGQYDELHTEGMLFDTRNGGFAGMVVRTDNTGIKYTGEGWNKTASFAEVMMKFYSTNSLQIHAWCIDKGGKTYDYDDYHLGKNCLFHSDKVIRVRADEHTTATLMPLLQTNFEAWLRVSGKTVNEHMDEIRRHTFDDHHCWHRAMLLEKSNPDKYTLVIGSYGFRQPDGRNTFWLWGDKPS